VDEDEDDRVRNVTVWVKRPGHRAVHPGKYMFRSESTRKTSLLRAAWAAPEMFQTGIVRAHIFPLRPVAKTEWDVLLAVSFPIPLSAAVEPTTGREFGAILSRGSAAAHRFSRRITLKPHGPDVDSTPTITFLERVKLKPGTYTLTAVLSDPRDIDPHAAKIRVDVPEIPTRGLFLVGPVLGRPSGPNLVITGGGSDAANDTIGSERSFEPLLVQHLEEPADLVALTEACLVNAKKRRRRACDATAHRALLDADGQPVGDLDDVALGLEGVGRVRCGTLLDVVPAGSLAPGEYEFDVVLDADRCGDGDTAGLRFAVKTPELR
jgi:hypothetical protein